jgi:prophage DNA circulation protein
MTIFNTARLPQASWRGKRFYYIESTINGGRKTVTHEYPDTNVRYVEDLGKIEKTYNIEAVINSNVSFSVRDGFLKVLEEGGLGKLVHPAFGSKDVVLKSYSMIDSTSSLGIAKFSLVFEEASLNKFPKTTKGNKGFLANLKSKILGDAEGKFDAAWQSVKKAKEVFDSANASLSNFANELKRVASLVQGSLDTFSDFTTSINEIIDGTRSLIQTPSILASKIKSSFNNLSVAFNRSRDLFDVLTNFFGYDGSDQVANGNSANQKQIKSNQQQLAQIFQVSALSLAYDAAANIDYQTQDELLEVISKLEDGFNKLPANIDRELYRDLLQMRIEAQNVFNNLSISLPKISNFQTQKTSLNVLVYSLYGDLSKKEQINNLNKFQDTSRIEGNIKILSNV